MDDIHMADMNRLEKAGGTAFPTQIQHGDGVREIWPGMTLRDYFAAAVMQGLQVRDSWHESDAARIAYRVADAMLAERAK